MTVPHHPGTDDGSGLPLVELDATDDPLRYRWTPSPLVLTPLHTIQGGAGLGAAVAAMERATGRQAVWATAQYLSFAVGTAPVDLVVTIEVTGHHTSQARCVVSRDGTEILTTHAALGRRDLDVEGVWSVRPDVPPAQDCLPYGFLAGSGNMGELVEIRLAKGRPLEEVHRSRSRGDGTVALWVRLGRGSREISVPDLTFIGDFMPMAFADALGAPFAGNSLDNTVRVGRLAVTEWVLIVAHVQQVVNGFGHGTAEMWAEDGTLLGLASQTVIIRRHDRLQQMGSASS